MICDKTHVLKAIYRVLSHRSTKCNMEFKIYYVDKCRRSFWRSLFRLKYKSTQIYALLVFYTRFPLKPITLPRMSASSCVFRQQSHSSSSTTARMERLDCGTRMSLSIHSWISGSLQGYLQVRFNKTDLFQITCIILYLLHVCWIEFRWSYKLYLL